MRSLVEQRIRFSWCITTNVMANHDEIGFVGNVGECVHLTVRGVHETPRMFGHPPKLKKLSWESVELGLFLSVVKFC